MSTENVLIWPKEYPLLLKGLLEQNGAFILDALEAWPKCQAVVDDQGINTCILAPLYYLLWQKPAEPFEKCFFQHIIEYDDDMTTYVDSAVNHLNSQLNNKESASELLLSRIENYASCAQQLSSNSPFSLTMLCINLRYFKVFQYLLDQGLKLSNEDALAIWQDDDFRAITLPYIEKGGHLCTSDELATVITDKLHLGQDYFDLLMAIKTNDIDGHILEQALLAHIKQDQAKQGICTRFLDQGATGTLRDENGMNAAMWAAKHGFAAVLTKLAKKDNVNSQDHDGNTILHHAVLSKSESCLSIALNAGVNFSLENKNELSAYRLAVSEKLDSVIKQFEKKFGIKELSKAEQFNWVKLVHSLHAGIVFLLPVQIFFILAQGFTLKGEVCFVITLTSMIMMFYALTLKRSPLYPTHAHPLSLTLLRILSPLALTAQLLVSFIIVISVLS